MDISDSSLTPHTNSLVKFLDCDHSLPGGVNILSEFHDLRLYGRDILRVCLNRINHRLQYARCLSHIGQSYVSYRLPDPVGALDASVIFGFQSGKSSTKFVCVLQIGRKRIRLYATNTVHIAHVRIFRIDNPPGIVKKGACLFSKRIKAANQMIASSVATVQLNFASRTGERKRFGSLYPLIAGRKCAPEGRIGVDNRQNDGNYRRYGRGRWLDRFWLHNRISSGTLCSRFCLDLSQFYAALLAPSDARPEGWGKKVEPCHSNGPCNPQPREAHSLPILNVAHHCRYSAATMVLAQNAFNRESPEELWNGMDDSRWRGCQRQALQVPWMAVTTGLGQVFKRCTGHLGERRPKEIIFEFNQKPISTGVEAIWDGNISRHRSLAPACDAAYGSWR